MLFIWRETATVWRKICGKHSFGEAVRVSTEEGQRQTTYYRIVTGKDSKTNLVTFHNGFFLHMVKGLDPAQNEKLQSIIHEHLRSTNAYGAIRSFVRDFLAQEEGIVHDEDKLLSALHEKRVVEDLLLSLGKEQDIPVVPASRRYESLARGGKHLHVRLGNASAFMDCLAESSASTGGTLVAHFLLLGQRHSTRPVPLAVEPNFDQQHFLFALPTSPDDILSLRDPMHVVVVQHGADDESTIVGAQSIEWRKVLVSGFLSLNVELAAVGGDAAVATGVLSLQMEMLPRVETKLFEEITVKSQIKSERDKDADVDRRFFAMAKTWWKEYLGIRPEHSSRAVKIFARGEDDVNRPVCCFLQPIEAGRAIRTVGEAARFVSLVEYQRIQVLGGTSGRSDTWADLHSVLASRKGDVEEHALLLCSLLLGFDLDAYCVVGTTLTGEPHMWVLTLHSSDQSSSPQATLWESLTGSRYVHTVGGPAAHKYGRVGCVFNDHSFYGNMQADDSVRMCCFDLANVKLWKGLDTSIISALPRRQPAPIVQHPMASHTMEETLETTLRNLIHEHRRDTGLSTHWDAHLSFLLGGALYSYEAERVTGVASGAVEFQQSIRRAVPDGFTFKGFPIHFAHLSAPRMFRDMLRSKVAAEIVSLQGGVEQVRFAIRVYVAPYPERVCAVWAMLAVVYSKLDDD